MAYFKNGWPLREDTKHLVRCEAAGFSFWIANEDLRVVFESFVRDFDSIIERIEGNILDDWSWANRKVRGSSTVTSFHAFGLALDLNALKHPRGVRYTFSVRQRQDLAKLLDKYKRLIRWGGSFSTVVDDMHFEWIGTPEQAKKLAKELSEDMPLSDADLNKISALIDSRLKNFWTRSTVIENRALGLGDKDGADISPAEAAARLDKKADLILRKLREE